MARILRGDIYWAALDPVKGHEQAGTRPVLITSPVELNSKLGIVIAASISSQQPKLPFPLSYPLPDGLLPRPSWVLIFQIRSLAVERLGKRIARLENDEVDWVVAGLSKLVTQSY
jgi:mRNA interferase MazF